MLFKNIALNSTLAAFLVFGGANVANAQDQNQAATSQQQQAAVEQQLSQALNQGISRNQAPLANVLNALNSTQQDFNLDQAAVRRVLSQAEVPATSPIRQMLQNVQNLQRRGQNFSLTQAAPSRINITQDQAQPQELQIQPQASFQVRQSEDQTQMRAARGISLVQAGAPAREQADMVVNQSNSGPAVQPLEQITPASANQADQSPASTDQRPALDQAQADQRPAAPSRWQSVRDQAAPSTSNQAAPAQTEQARPALVRNQAAPSSTNQAASNQAATLPAAPSRWQSLPARPQRDQAAPSTRNQSAPSRNQAAPAVSSRGLGGALRQVRDQNQSQQAAPQTNQASTNQGE